MKVLPLTCLTASALFLYGCGGGDSDSTQTSNVSFAVSDAPVDEASSVTIGFTQIELVKSNGQSIYLDVEPSEPSNDYEQVDLLDYQGKDSKLIVSSQPVPVGTYKNLILHISSESGVNFVDDNDGTQALKQPSNKLQLGGFEVTAKATQQFTIEFDLRQSLVMRGNSGTTNGYILKPHGVTIINNSEAASLSGTVDPTWFSEGTCAAGSGNYVYLYQGDVTDENLIDLIDETDSTFSTGDSLPDTYAVPYATADVDDSGAYAFGYLPSGDYTVAITCDGGNDDSIEYDGIEIPSFTSLLKTITLDKNVTSTLNFAYE